MTRPTNIKPLAVICLLFMVPATDLQARAWMIGPDYSAKNLREIITQIEDGDTIGIMAGVYENDFVTLTRDNVTITGIGGYAHMKASAAIANRKAIWIVRGENVTLKNIEFSGARVPDKNGAGIRFEGGSLILENCYFHDNEMGIMTINDPSASLKITRSEFRHNVQDYPKTGKLSHNIYVGALKSFTLEDSISRGAQYGHTVKSRAMENTIRNNRIFDEGDISASYLIDLPNGGVGLIENNYFYRNQGAQNNVVISYGAENMSYADNRLVIRDNTAVNEEGLVFLLRNHSAIPAEFTGNILDNITALEAPAFKRDGLLNSLKQKLRNSLN